MSHNFGLVYIFMKDSTKTEFHQGGVAPKHSKREVLRSYVYINDDRIVWDVIQIIGW